MLDGVVYHVIGRHFLFKNLVIGTISYKKTGRLLNSFLGGGAELVYGAVSAFKGMFSHRLHQIECKIANFCGNPHGVVMGKLKTASSLTMLYDENTVIISVILVAALIKK